MAISYNTGTTATVGASGTNHGTVTVPAGVLNGDVILVLVTCFTTSAGSPALSLTSTGTTPIPQGAIQSASGGGIITASQVFSIAATGSDAGATLTYTITGVSGGSYWFDVGLVSYSGAGSVDVIAGTEFFSSSSAGTTTTPSATTVTAGDWQVQLLGVAPPNGANFTVPAGLTGRQAITSGVNAGILLSIADSNGSAGGAGSPIGNTTWTASGAGASNTWSTSFTVGLAPPSGPVTPPENPTPPRIPHPLWHELLEVAWERADWQQQGAATPVAATWRLMDGVAGRPGTGSSGTQPPASATANSGSLVNGTTFYVTQSGLWFTGYWWYVAASGGQSTAATKFALWACNANSGGSGGAVIPASVVTSGALTAGWNYVPLARPVQLALYGIYQAAVGLNSGPYPVTAAQTAAGDPYSGGWASGPLVQPSESSGSNGVAVVGAGASATSGTDPSLVMPGGDAGAGNIYWLDVQVTNTPPVSYNGSYRLWPNMNDSDYLTQADASVNYVLATEFILSQACVVNAIWYYVPGGMGATGNQWATSADIWRVRDQVRVATQPSPTWLRPFTGGPDGQSNSGRWVYTQLPGTVTLPPGDYKVSVYNGNASPNAWSAKRLGYWQAYGQRADGTYLHNPPGAGGIANGPLAAPTTPAASSATDFSNPAVTEPGQSTFQSGPPNQYPDLYVGTPVNLFQNYWVDVEVTPASTFQPDQPLIPQRIPSPVFYDLLEIAEARILNGTPAPVPAAVAGVPAPLALGAPAGSVSAGASVTGTVAPLALGAPAGTVSAGASVAGAVAGLALAAPAGTVSAGADIAGVPASLALDAPAGQVTVPASVTGVTALLALDAPAGSAAVTAGVTGVAALLALDAPAGSVSAGADITGVTAPLTLDAPAGTAAAGTAVAGLPAPLALAAPAGTVTAGADITGLAAPLALAAPAGSVSAGAVIAGMTAPLALDAPAGLPVTGAGVAGIPAALALAAFPGTVTAGASVTGTMAQLILAAPPGTPGIPGPAILPVVSVSPVNPVAVSVAPASPLRVTITSVQA